MQLASICRRANGSAWWFSVLLLCGLAGSEQLALGQAGEEHVPAKPVCAIIDAAGLAVTPLLEGRLLADDGATWVERTEIERVLREQELQTAFGAADGARRSALGQLLKADVLILLRSQKNSDPGGPELIDCIVCETRQGLRLRTLSLPADKDLETVADELARAVAQGLAKRQQKIEAIVAVPPFLSDDLDFQNNHLQAAYAKLVEQVLLERPGVLVVELGEAQAIARELTLDKAGAGLEQRRLPLYVIGRYRHDTVGDERRLRMSLRLARGAEQLALKGIRDLAPGAAPPWIVTKTNELSQQLEGLPAAAEFSPDVEARQLAARAKDFQRVGNWEEAYALYEASLLLKDNEDAHRQAVIVAGKYGLELWPREYDLEKYKLAMALYERGLEHLERFLRTAEDISKYQHKDGGNFAMDFDTFLYMHISHPDNKPEVKELAGELRRRRTQTYLRIARMRADAKKQDRGDNHAWDAKAVWLLPQEEQLAAILRVAQEWSDLPDIRQRLLRMTHRGFVSPDDTPALQQFLKDLARIAPHGSEVATTIRERMAAHQRHLQEMAQRKAPAKVPVDPAIKKVEFAPVPAEAAKWNEQTSSTLNDALALDNGADLFMAGRRIYIMDKGSTRLRTLFEISELRDQILAKAFDGKYLWLAMSESSRSGALLAVDPATGKTVRFTAEDGLPFTEEDPNRDYRDHLQLAGVSPGHVCIVGYMGRSWIANVLLDKDGKKRVDVIHEAREVANGSDESQGNNPKVAFQPGFFYTLRGRGDDSCRLVLGRNSPHPAVRHKPLLIDPVRRTVEVADYLLPGDTDRSLLAADRSAIYVLRQNHPRGPKLMRVAYPGDKMALLLEDAPDGKLAATGQSLEIIGKKWWTCDPEKRAIQERTAGVAWHHGNMFFVAGVDNSSDRNFVADRDGHPLAMVKTTNHFGAVAIAYSHGKPLWFYLDASALSTK